MHDYPLEERTIGRILAEKAGRIPGLRARWLTRDVNDPDAGYSISLWQDPASMKAYEGSSVLENDIRPRLAPFFSGQYTTTHCEMRSHEVFD